MQKNILVDLNVLLDVFLERPGYQASRRIIEHLSESKRYHLYISAYAITTLAYLLERARVPRKLLLKHLNWVLQTFETTAIDGTLLKSALESQVYDYEDAVVERAALACSASVIITRNVKDFKASKVPALNPEAYLNFR